MNNKGFTLVEVLMALALLAIISFYIINNVYGTLSINKEEAYKIMKNNIISAAYTYVEECNSKTITCDFDFETKNEFIAEVLEEKGYFKNLNSPIDGKNLGECLIAKASKSNGVVVIDLVDNCY